VGNNRNRGYALKGGVGHKVEKFSNLKRAQAKVTQFQQTRKNAIERRFKRTQQ
jgi:hypothetical protein